MNRWYQFVETAEFQPTDSQPESSDLIYAYSAFSHLSDQVQEEWLEEFSLLAKPGGIVVVTSFPIRSPLRPR